MFLTSECRYILSLTLLSGILASPTVAMAQERAGSKSGFFVEAQGGPTTHKSKLAGSNDTGFSYRYGAGSLAGSAGQLRFQIMRDSLSTKFLLNESQLSMEWQDTSLAYHWTYGYVGSLFSLLEIEAQQEGQDTIDGSGSGFGALAGLTFGVGRRSQIGLDITQAVLSKVTNALDTELKVPNRLDIDLGAQTSLNKSTVLLFGYRLRQLSLNLDGSSFAEQITSTYLGLRYSLSF